MSQTIQDPEIPDLGLLASYKPYFTGKTGSLAIMAAASFIAGALEAVLLVMIANIALTVGSSTTSQGIAADVGPLSSLHLSVGTSFLVALGLGFARMAFQLVAAEISGRITAELISEIRGGTFRDYASASWAEQSRRKESDVQDLLVRHVSRATGGIGAISRGISTACLVVALLVSAVVVDPISAGLLVVSGAVLFFGIRPLTQRAKTLSQAQLVAGRNYAAMSLEALAISQEIRSFGVNEPVIASLEKATEDEVRPTYRSLVLREVVTSAYQLSTILLLLGGLFAVYTFVDRPLASLGAIVIILVRTLNQTGQLQAYYHTLVETAPYLNRLTGERAQLRAQIPRSGNRVIEAPSRLRFDHVSYAYDGAKPAVADLSFDVNRGEAIGIVGPSGSGKSTLIQLLLRLRQPDSGQYLLDDVDASDVDDDSWFEQIAFVPQESRLTQHTIAENIAFFRSGVTREDIVSAAKRAHIHDEILAMPEGYDTVLGSRGGALSGGQRQRISIARALLREPSILVLDEPTSALDMRSESLVHETFTELRGQVTIFVIAHRLSTLNTCDRIMVLTDGELQGFGTREDLQRDSEFFRDALRLSAIKTTTDAAD